MKLKITSKIILVCVSLVTLTSIFLGYYSIQEHTQQITSNLVSDKKNQLKLLTAHLDARLDELKHDALFLTSTPPIQGLIRAKDNKGFDPVDRSTTQQWLDRLGVIFQEMMYAKEDYFQIRLIGVSDEGKELIRVERSRAKVRRASEADLQKKAERDYFKETLELGRDQVYLSRFD